LLFMQRIFVSVLCCCGLACAADQPTLRLAHVFSDHGVLQRERPLPVWGWAAPGAQVSVALAGQSRTATAGADGRWSVTFNPLTAGNGPLELTASSGEATATVGDLLVGEVWLCSGQSNMEWAPNWGVLNGPKEIAAAAGFPTIRLLNVAKNSSDTPVADITATWEVCSPETVGNFSAVSYFFARELSRGLDVPVGVIASSWGGTPAQSWTSREALSASPKLVGYVKSLDAALAAYPAAKASYDELLKNPPTLSKSDDTGWEKPDLAMAEWKEMALPQNWEKAGLNIDGVVWFRRTLDIPVAAAGKDLVLGLGPIDDQDITWWDGEKIGSTAVWNEARNYTVPARLVSAGRHVIAVRVTDTGYGGGIFGKPEQLAAHPAVGEAISLAGSWQYRVAEVSAAKPQAPMGPGNPWLPTGLRNGMITPLIPYAMRGAIWYQGESNTGQAWQYRTLFPAMITDWRAAWGQGDFPFLFVQLANFTAAAKDPGDSDWAELRDAQLFTLRSVPATGMAVTIDIGDAGNIHPANKQEVSRRLSLWALAHSNGKQIETSGPLYTGAKIEGARIRVTFDHLGGGLVAQGGALQRFAIAGADKTWKWADAVIDGDTVLVSSPQVAQPVAVRYAWANNPEGCNLYNTAGLPASPFRTDDWPAVTDR
jgi:sialate O-acetylesterase